MDKTHDKDRYYDVGGIRTLEVLQAKLSGAQYEGFLLGNALKYLLRYNWKGGKVDDARKAATYARWLHDWNRARQAEEDKDIEAGKIVVYDAPEPPDLHKWEELRNRDMQNIHKPLSEKSIG